jgi:hypothetical protein
MLLGLALLTVAANVVVLAFHALLHLGLALPMRAADALVLAALALGPVLAIALMLQGRPRHGAALLALLMILSLASGLLSHYAQGGPDEVAAAQRDLWGRVYATSATMQVAFALQGFALAAILLVKPEVPRPSNAEIPAP